MTISPAIGALLAICSASPSVAATRPAEQQAAREPVRLARPDALQPVPPADVTLTGYLGRRIDNNRKGILMHKDEKALLDPFRHRSRSQSAWIGEHIGKWLSATATACASSRNPDLQAKLTRVASELMATQMPDGYLGTYADTDHWTSWDVWVHKYNLLGLEACDDLAGDARALETCRKIGDLMIGTFGPDKRDILKAGENAGMAATSILEPMLWLYRRTGDARYLHFAEYIVASLERSGGPRIVSTLLETRNVQRVANAKGYEMLSNILGLLDMYRLQGDPTLLEAASIAFEDITRNRTYITGGSTYGELFCEPGVLPNVGHVAETCVSMSLLQLYRSMLQLTGENKYGSAAEHLIYNHLLACQHPTGESICYYTPLWGHKFYMTMLGCCISSGPRAIAFIPSLGYLQKQDEILINLLGPGTLDTQLPGGRHAHLEQTGDYPFSDRITINAAGSSPGYSLSIRIPDCANNPRAIVNGRPWPTPLAPGDSFRLAVAGDEQRIELDLGFRWKIIRGTGANHGLFALQYGPVIYAYDYAANAKQPRAIHCAFAADVEKLAPSLREIQGRWIAEVNGHLLQADGSWTDARLKLLPFADAGETDYFSVWLPERTGYNFDGISLFTQAHEACSRQGRHHGSISDNSPETLTSTDNGAKAAEDWFEVSDGWHTQYNVIIFRHGKSSANGGWFDTSKGKPKISFKTWTDYHQVGELTEYPDTTAESPGALRDGQAFRFVIPRDKRDAAFRIRISGVPAHGNDPARNFATCSEIQAFYDPDL